MKTLVRLLLISCILTIAYELAKLALLQERIDQKEEALFKKSSEIVLFTD